MNTFSIAKNPYGGGSSKIISTDLPDDVMVEVLKGYSHNGKHQDGTWRAQLNKREEASLTSKLTNTCAEIARREAATQAENVVTLHEQPSRFVVEAGKHKVGDRLGTRIITKLGREWKINSEETSAWGLGPWVEWVQYAYFD